MSPNVIVPGHGPLCGLVGLRQMRSYLEHVWQKSKECFERGLKAVDAAKQIELHAFRDWHAPARVYMTVERNYRELQGQPFDAPWDLPSTFDAIHEVALARRVPTEF